MKVKRIIILILISFILFVNSTSVFAGEQIRDNIDTIENSGEDALIETNMSINTSAIECSTNLNGYVKPSNSLYDVGTEVYQKDNFASYYFYNLKEGYFGNNTHGSCGYVATAMMLSYYDTYFDDSIIDEYYDKNGYIVSNFDLESVNTYSPGILGEPNTIFYSDGTKYPLKDFSTDDYWNFIEDNYGKYFQLYLIKIAEEQFNMYHNTVGAIEECGITMEIDTENPCASAMQHQKSVIEYYLYQERGYNSNQVSLEYANTDIRNFAINKIKNGQPVMLLLGGDTGFHFVVAYDLDDKDTDDTSDDSIYAHYGWDEVEDANGNYKDAMHININTDEFSFLVSAMAINFADSVNHSHSDNYVDASGTTYCSCYFPCHPEHEHTYEQIEGDASQHRYTCGCAANEVNTAYHRFTTYASIDGTYHAKICADCGYSVTDEHNFSYESVNDDYHILTCTTCGATSGTRTSHSWTVMSGDNSLIGERVRCQFCGLTRLLGIDEFVPIIKENIKPEEGTE